LKTTNDWGDENPLRRRTAIIILTGLGLGAAALIDYILSTRRVTAEPPTPSEGVRFEVETVAEGLIVPWEMAFISGDEAILTERPGSMRLLDVSTGRVELLGSIRGVEHVGEGGLLGLDINEHGSVFAYYTYRDRGQLYNRVYRWRSLDLRDGGPILDRIPASPVHNGGRVKLGPDRKLYVTTGDAASPESSQDLRSLAGKILRINTDGSAPPDNPFPSSPVYSYGHRNPQGICWRRDGRLYATEHGPSGEMGLVANDEVNMITPGGNYGWPRVVGPGGGEGYIDPVYHSGSETWAPSGCTFYYGNDFPEWDGNLFFASLRGQHLHRVVLNDAGEGVIRAEKLLVSSFGRLRNVVEGPDGALYLLTSNKDGRGTPAPGDDKVLRVAPRR